ncbi:hypothetical protein HY624_03880, partial [Candidatus Uhrbacteria bacterium]|nr:hypothetical protein [Candidatus Uhrbacteria bacterium]
MRNSSRIVGIHTDHTNGSIDGDLAFVTRNNNTFEEQMRIINTGNVGIGTTSPATRFSVAGNTYFGSNIITYSSSTASSLQLAFQSSATSTIPNNLVNAWSISTSTSITPILTIDTTGGGRIGIGTTTPAQFFSVASTTYLGGALGVGVATTAPGVIQTSGVIVVGGSGTSTFANGITFTNGCLLLPSGQCAGTGGSGGGGWTDSGSFVQLTTTADQVTVGATAAISPAVLSVTATTSTAVPLIVQGAASQSVDLLRIQNSGGTNLVVVDSAGRFGIGTSTPGATLAVNGPIFLDSRLISFASSSAAELTVAYQAAATTTVLNNTINIWSIATSTSDVPPLLSFDTGRGGRVSIGMASSTAFLGVRGANSSNASFHVENGTAPASPLIGDIYSDGTDLLFYDGTGWQDLTIQAASGAGGWTDGGSVVSVTTDGDSVGIGDTTADARLEVSANGGAATLLMLSSNDANDGDRLIVTNAGNVGIGTTTPLGLLSVNANGIGSNPQFVVGSSTKTDFVITNAGNVGIGTGDPSALLHVVGGLT